MGFIGCMGLIGFLGVTWKPRGLSKSVISRMITRVTPIRVLITRLITHLLSPPGLQVIRSRGLYPFEFSIRGAWGLGSGL